MRALVFALIAAAVLAASPPAQAQSAAGLVDEAVVDRAVDYLNRVRTLQAKFVQRDERGRVYTGRLWMERPGRLRLEYDPPLKDVIWSEGGFVKHFDAALEAVTHVPRHLTPAWFLLDGKVEITEDIEVLATADLEKRYFVTLAQAGRLADGRITLAFDAAPERIAGWTVTSGEGAITQVDLVEVSVGQPIRAKVFQYEPPIPDTVD